MGISIKDFNVGDNVYTVLLNKNRVNDSPSSLREAKVSKVGRSYVYINTNFSRNLRFKPPTDSHYNYLIEDVDWGTPRHLFKNQEDAKKFVEADELKTQLSRVLNWTIIDKFTLDQLKRIEVIIKEVEGNDN